MAKKKSGENFFEEIMREMEFNAKYLIFFSNYNYIGNSKTKELRITIWYIIYCDGYCKRVNKKKKEKILNTSQRELERNYNLYKNIVRSPEFIDLFPLKYLHIYLQPESTSFLHQSSFASAILDTHCYTFIIYLSLLVNNKK